MAVSQNYDIIDTEKGLLDRSIFTDKQIYQEELEKIFGRAWLFIGHESIIPNPNDFFLTYMGEDPVILTRDAKGDLHAFLNMCRHRGNRIVRADDGNAKNFMCAYHGWTYSNEGKLVSVPGLQEAYYGELDVDKLGLVPVAQLDTYAGMIFATWADDSPGLEAYLGNIRYYMDVAFNRRDGGTIFLGPDKWIIPNNWKTSADNFIGDMYHAPLSHRSAITVMAKRRDQPTPPLSYEMKGGNQVSPGNGHGCNALIFETNDQQLEMKAAFSHPDTLEYERTISAEMDRRLGLFRSRRMLPSHHTVFPNFSWLSNNVARVWHPHGPYQTLVWAFAFIDESAPQKVRQAYRQDSMHTFGPSGLLEQDDMDNWRGTTQAGRSSVARKSWQVLSMGLGHERDNPELPGRSVAAFCSEINQRSMYVRWQEMMNAQSWADISVDPITAKFEGTATMKG
jgi:phenylpropionate dioxygenase-like ring-hydroxylating dioxygenase large terminal subunit